MWTLYVLCVSSLLCCLASSTYAAVLYTVHDLGEVTNVGNVNDQQRAAGLGRAASGELVPAVLQQGSPPQSLLAPGWIGGSATAISNTGTIVGGSGTTIDNIHFAGHLFRWTVAQGMQALTPLPGEEFPGAATGINAVDTITGFAVFPNSQRRPTAWVSGAPMDLGTQGAEGVAQAINDQGDIVGEAQFAGSTQFHAALWPLEGGVVDLQTLPATFSLANALGTDRRVVGSVCPTDSPCQGFLWTAATGMQGLAFLPGDVFHTATGINEAGVIVGAGQQAETYPFEHPPHALRWQGGVPTDLNTVVNAPDWHLIRATGINQAGWIVGIGMLGQTTRAFLLEPVTLTVPPAPVPLVAQVRGDVNGDGWQDQAGLTADGAIWLGLAGQAWQEVGGRLQTLLAGDLDGDGRADLVGGIYGTVWTMTDGVHWQQQPTPGSLHPVVLGNFYDDGRQHLAGLTADGRIWRSPTLGQWEEVGGRLATLLSCDLTGAGRDDLAGLEAGGTIWLNIARRGWIEMGGQLAHLEGVGQPCGLAGMDGGGGWWWSAPRVFQWQRITGAGG